MEIVGLIRVELVDIFGIDEIDVVGWVCLVFCVVMGVDLVLLVVDSDLIWVDLEVLCMLLESGKFL